MDHDAGEDMLEQLAKEAGKSIWREVGEKALKDAVGTLASEGVKAIVEVWKKRRIRHDEHEFDAWKSANGKPGEEASVDEQGDVEKPVAPDSPVEEPTADEPDEQADPEPVSRRGAPTPESV